MKKLLLCKTAFRWVWSKRTATIWSQSTTNHFQTVALTSTFTVSHLQFSACIERHNMWNILYWKMIFSRKIIYTLFSFFTNYIITVYIILFYSCLFYYSCAKFSPLPSFVQPTLPSSHGPSPHHCPHPFVFFDYSLLLLSLCPSSPLSSGSSQSVPCFHVPGSVVLISLFYSLGSSYKWDHMVFVFH